jgi:hypothetical protein
LKKRTKVLGDYYGKREEQNRNGILWELGYWRDKGKKKVLG